jgi:hypothetical protein
MRMVQSVSGSPRTTNVARAGQVLRNETDLSSLADCSALSGLTRRLSRKRSTAFMLKKRVIHAYDPDELFEMSAHRPHIVHG